MSKAKGILFLGSLLIQPNHKKGREVGASTLTVNFTSSDNEKMHIHVLQLTNRPTHLGYWGWWKEGGAPSKLFCLESAENKRRHVQKWFYWVKSQVFQDARELSPWPESESFFLFFFKTQYANRSTAQNVLSCFTSKFNVWLSLNTRLEGEVFLITSSESKFPS